MGIQERVPDNCCDDTNDNTLDSVSVGLRLLSLRAGLKARWIHGINPAVSLKWTPSDPLVIITTGGNLDAHSIARVRKNERIIVYTH